MYRSTHHQSCTPVSESFPGGAIILALLLLAGLRPAAAQNRPPAHVANAVDAVIALARSSGDEAIEQFIDEAMAPSAVGDRDETARHLARIRDAVSTLQDGISVEDDGSGPVIVFNGGSVEQHVRLDVTPEGIRALSIAEPSSDPTGGLDGAVRAHVRAIEGLANAEFPEALDRFEAERLAPSFLDETTSSERMELLHGISNAAANAGSVTVDFDGIRYVIRFSGMVTRDVTFGVQPNEPWKIVHLELHGAARDEPEEIGLTPDTLEDTFRDLEGRGFSGAVYIRLGGEVVLADGYGLANPDLGIPVTLDTIFGIGSTPIDFTIASARLLMQQERLNPDASIAEYIEGVPSDKQGMTIRHLIEGRSGLPDFFDTPDDWDADLAWINRDTAVRRMMAQELLFEPGTNRAHSHGAYVLLAAIVEITSGTDYASFIRSNFLEPAGMIGTGMYGNAGSHALEDFAVGQGDKHVGLPNIPPNWGPTSWLIMGSGGMYSTARDLIRFYDFIRSGDVLDERFAEQYHRYRFVIGGSERGFYVVHSMKGPGNAALILTNQSGQHPMQRSLTRSLRALIEQTG